MASGKKLGFFSLIAIVVGSMIGGGAFNLATDMASGASAGAILIGWVITGIGMIALGLTFQNLTDKRPDLDGGIFSYATEGFGKFMGFNSAWGYWFSAWLGNVAYATLLFSSIGYFFPIFKGGQNIVSIIGASILLWLVHALILRGVQSAALVNLITTIAKLVPVFLFIILGIFAFHFKTFTGNFWGADGTFHLSEITAQVKSTMLVTLWVFIGIEGAVVLSSRAKDKKDVGKATIIGLLGTLLIYILITIMSLGAMSQPEIAKLDSPSMAFVFEHIVGKWGAAFINLGLIVSVLGAWLGWTLLAAEIPFLSAKSGLFPKWFTKENKNGAPINSLWVTNGFIQIFLLSFLFTTKAYQFAFSLASSAILIPYAFSAFYQFKYSLQSKDNDRMKNITIGIVASIYSLWMIYAAGISYLLLTMILYAPGILVYQRIQKETKVKKIFTRPEFITALAFTLLAAIAIYQLIIGKISI